MFRHGICRAVDRGKRALVTAQRERILLFARDAVVAARGFPRPAGREVDIGILINECGIRRDLLPPIGTRLSFRRLPR